MNKILSFSARVDTIIHERPLRISSLCKITYIYYETILNYAILCNHIKNVNILNLVNSGKCFFLV